jgi:methionyl-tRNA formyltransferase
MQSGRHIHNQVRGLLPWPCAHTHYKGMFIKVLKTALLTGPVECPPEFSPGQVVAIEKNKGIVVAVKDAVLLIETLQSEGKRAMPAYDFVLGHHVRVGDAFGE